MFLGLLEFLDLRGRPHQISLVFRQLFLRRGFLLHKLGQSLVLLHEHLVTGLGDLQVVDQRGQLLRIASGLRGLQLILLRGQFRMLLTELCAQVAVVHRNQQFARANGTTLGRGHGRDKTIELRAQRVRIDGFDFAVAGDPGVQVTAHQMGQRDLRLRAAPVHVVQQHNRKKRGSPNEIPHSSAQAHCLCFPVRRLRVINLSPILAKFRETMHFQQPQQTSTARSAVCGVPIG